MERGDAPGVVGIAVNRDGVTYEGAFGKARLAEDVDMRTDAIFTIASMTKGITSLAVMQAVDDGALSLDTPAQDFHPELADLELLDAELNLRPAKGVITLRHLLTHTSGFGYEFSSKRLVAGLAANGISGFDADGALNTRVPLLFEPGQRWQYGVNTDWAAECLERATGRTLPEFVQDRIFEPLGMVDAAYGVSEANAARRTTLHARNPDESFNERKPAPPSFNRQGGAGMTSTASDYARFLRFMLGDGTWNDTQVLSREGMQGLCSDQIPSIVAGEIFTGVPAMSNDAPFSEGGTAGHSLGFVYSRRAASTGRSPGTLSWGGLFNTYYWIDRAKGVAGAIFFQLLPFADPTCLRVYSEFEAAVYEVTDS